ncbi:hypothetical protein DFQ13_105351 [Actinokineospora spheciospongiae]|nr:hypothetical protein DFQ13_105351 [Actinokineospora spheciospongiae]
MMVPVTDADDLYALPREEFVAARRALARAAKAEGDPARAAEIERLAKPTTAAWLVNRLVRDHPDSVTDLLDLGADLRAAHAGGSGAQLRALTRRRTELLADLVRTAADGASPSEPVTRELEDMFTAALTDEAAAARLAEGRVTSAKDFAVTEVWPGLSIAPPPGKGRSAPAKAAPTPTDKAALKAARAAVKEAESTRADADRAATEAEQAITAAEDRVRELNAELDAAEHAELAARRALQVARREAKAAERAAGQAWRRLRQVEGTDATED